MKAFFAAAVLFAFLPAILHVSQFSAIVASKQAVLKNGIMLEQALAEKRYSLEAGFSHAVRDALAQGSDACAALEKWAFENDVKISTSPACSELLDIQNKTAVVKCTSKNSHCEWTGTITPGFTLETRVRGLAVRAFIPKGTVIE